MIENFKSLRFAPLLFLTVLVIGCTKNEEQTPAAVKLPIVPTESTTSKTEAKPFEYCSDHSLCKDLRENENKCRTNPSKGVCQSFIELFKKLAVIKDCKRKFDTKPVPSVWICDEDIEETSYPKLFERSASTLAKTKYDFARKFYGSEAFRSTLDGAVSEDHYEESLKVGNEN